MPLWTIRHTTGVFTAEDKKNLSSEITAGYQRVGLPKFYVVVVFDEIEPGNLFVGGEPVELGVRVIIEHIARHLADSTGRRRVALWINDVLRPYCERHEGLHWEFHVDETSEELWMINGLVPPPGGSDTEKAWADANAALPY